MTSSLLTTERAAYRERERTRQTERMARCCVRVLRPGVGRAQIEELARERWRLTVEDGRAVADAAERIREVGGRHLTIEDLKEEADMAKSEAKVAVHETTRAVLTERPSMGRHDAYAVVQQRTGTTILQSTWEVEHFYPVRREMGLGRAKKEPEALPVPPRRYPSRPRPGSLGRESAPAPGASVPEPSVPQPDPRLKHLDGQTEVEIRLLQRLGELEVESREIQMALAVICRLRPAA